MEVIIGGISFYMITVIIALVYIIVNYYRDNSDRKSNIIEYILDYIEDNLIIRIIYMFGILFLGLALLVIFIYISVYVSSCTYKILWK